MSLRLHGFRRALNPQLWQHAPSVRIRTAANKAGGISVKGIEAWDCHRVAVWAYTLTDDPLILDFFALRTRLNGSSLLRLTERNRIKEIELQMRGANIQFADVKCDIIREALKEVEKSSDGERKEKVVQIAGHGGLGGFTGRFAPHSVTPGSFGGFLAARGASGVVGKSGSVVTHFEGLTDGEEYALVRGGWDGEDPGEIWPRVTISTALAFLEDHLAGYFNQSNPYKPIDVRKTANGRTAVLLRQSDAKSAVVEYLPQFLPTTLPTPLPALLSLFSLPTNPLHILASPSIPPDGRQKLFTLSPIDLVLSREEWNGHWTLRSRRRLVELDGGQPQEAEKESKVVDVAVEERESVVLEPMNVSGGLGDGLDKVITGDVVGR